MCLLVRYNEFTILDNEIATYSKMCVNVKLYYECLNVAFEYVYVPVL